jgi:hypothetical protein
MGDAPSSEEADLSEKPDQPGKAEKPAKTGGKKSKSKGGNFDKTLKDFFGKVFGESGIDD